MNIPSGINESFLVNINGINDTVVIDQDPQTNHPNSNNNSFIGTADATQVIQR